jgi:hypothetical protein
MGSETRGGVGAHPEEGQSCRVWPLGPGVRGGTGARLEYGDVWWLESPPRRSRDLLQWADRDPIKHNIFMWYDGVPVSQCNNSKANGLESTAVKLCQSDH